MTAKKPIFLMNDGDYRYYGWQDRNGNSFIIEELERTSRLQYRIGHVDYLYKRRLMGYIDVLFDHVPYKLYKLKTCEKKGLSYKDWCHECQGWWGPNDEILVHYRRWYRFLWHKIHNQRKRFFKKRNLLKFTFYEVSLDLNQDIQKFLDTLEGYDIFPGDSFPMKVLEGSKILEQYGK